MIDIVTIVYKCIIFQTELFITLGSMEIININFLISYQLN